MKIKYTSGPNAGKVTHVSNEVGRGFIDAGFAEETGEPVTPTPPSSVSSLDQLRDHQRRMNPAAKADEAQWSVEYLGLVQKSWFIVLRVGAYTVKFGGDPKIVNARHTWEGGGRWLSGFGRECPASIVKEYAARYANAKESERFYPPVEGFGQGYAENLSMATKQKTANDELARTEQALANFDIRKDLTVSKVIGGPDESGVTYELGDPAKGS